MKIISYNVNGIRAALKKGFIDWLKSANPDVICLQEIKAQEDQLDLSVFENAGYHYSYWFSAQKKGYSGVAILSKKEPTNVVYGTGIESMDFEGRNIRVDFDGVSVMSLYLPSGTNLARLEHKLEYMDLFQDYINTLKKEVPNLIICGDYNICHEAIDIHDPVRNKNISGFLPEERAWMSQFLDCFSKDEIIGILKKVARAADENCAIYILEPLWDLQKFAAASYSLNHISLYFTCMANGNSKMYSFAEFKACIAESGLVLTEVHHDLGPHSYTLLECRIA